MLIVFSYLIHPFPDGGHFFQKIFSTAEPGNLDNQKARIVLKPKESVFGERLDQLREKRIGNVHRHFEGFEFSRRGFNGFPPDQFKGCGQRLFQEAGFALINNPGARNIEEAGNVEQSAGIENGESFPNRYPRPAFFQFIPVPGFRFRNDLAFVGIIEIAGAEDAFFISNRIIVN